MGYLFNLTLSAFLLYTASYITDAQNATPTNAMPEPTAHEHYDLPKEVQEDMRRNANLLAKIGMHGNHARLIYNALMMEYSALRDISHVPPQFQVLLKKVIKDMDSAHENMKKAKELLNKMPVANKAVEYNDEIELVAMAVFAYMKIFTQDAKHIIEGEPSHLQQYGKSGAWLWNIYEKADAKNPHDKAIRTGELLLELARSAVQRFSLKNLNSLHADPLFLSKIVPNYTYLLQLFMKLETFVRSIEMAGKDQKQITNEENGTATVSSSSSSSSSSGSDSSSDSSSKSNEESKEISPDSTHLPGIDISGIENKHKHNKKSSSSSSESSSSSASEESKDGHAHSHHSKHAHTQSSANTQSRSCINNLCPGGYTCKSDNMCYQEIKSKHDHSGSKVDSKHGSSKSHSHNNHSTTEHNTHDLNGNKHTKFPSTVGPDAHDSAHAAHASGHGLPIPSDDPHRPMTVKEYDEHLLFLTDVLQLLHKAADPKIREHGSSINLRKEGKHGEYLLKVLPQRNVEGFHKALDLLTKQVQLYLEQKMKYLGMVTSDNRVYERNINRSHQLLADILSEVTKVIKSQHSSGKKPARKHSSKWINTI